MSAIVPKQDLYIYIFFMGLFVPRGNELMGGPSGIHIVYTQGRSYTKFLLELKIVI